MFYIGFQVSEQTNVYVGCYLLIINHDAGNLVPITLNIASLAARMVVSEPVTE
jgi:hypothetical protein